MFLSKISSSTNLSSCTDSISALSIAVDLSSKNDNFSRSLGALNYIASRRDKVILISFPFPLSEKILLVSAEPNLEIEKLASKIVNIFSDSSITSD